MELMKTGDFVCLLQMENGDGKLQFGLLPTEMENGSLFSLVGKR
jgi:hypothetical protein